MASTRGSVKIYDQDVTPGASITVDNVFSSTYDSYNILVTGLTGSEATNQNVNLRLIESNSELSSAVYNSDFFYPASDNVTGNIAGFYNQTSWNQFAYVNSTSGDNVNLDIIIMGVNDTSQATALTFKSVEISNASWDGIFRVGGFYINSSGTGTGIKLFVTTGTITGGNIKIFGLKT